MNKLNELFEKYINSFNNTNVTLIHGGYVIFESTSVDVNFIKHELNPFGIDIESVGKNSYRFSIKYPKGKLDEVVNVLVERAA